MVKPPNDTSSPRLLLQLLASSWPDLLLCLFSGLLLLLPSLHLPLAVLLAYLMLRELLQLAVSVKRYLSSIENWLEMAMIGLVIAILNNTEADQVKKGKVVIQIKHFCCSCYNLNFDINECVHIGLKNIIHFLHQDKKKTFVTLIMKLLRC